MSRKSVISGLRASSERVGRLYPILLDKHGNVIDGEHRLAADENWPKVRLESVETEEQRLVARLISNTVRRSVPRREKVKLLSGLGEIYLSEGVELGEIAHKIAERIGMSYQWVMKYLPERFKDPLQSERAKPALRRRAGEKELTEPPKEKILTIQKYANASFINILLDKPVYAQLERAAERLGTTPDVILSNAILLTLKRLMKKRGKGYEKSQDEAAQR